MKNTFKKTSVIVSAILLFVIITALTICSSKIFVIKDLNSFSEAFLPDFSIDDITKKQIILMLKESAAENENMMGFSAVAATDSAGSNLYLLYSITEIAEVVGSNALREELSKKTDLIININTASLGVLDLIYYVEICEYLGISYSTNEVLNDLEKFYCKADDLFYMNNENDDFHTKTVLSAMCFIAIPEISDDGRYDLENGLEKVYRDYEFSTEPSKTLYNSGGDILYAMSVLRIADAKIIEAHRGWFEIWRERYEEIDVDSVGEALAYSEFLKVARFFDKNLQSNKIRNFCDSLGEEDVNEETDFLMLSNSIDMADKISNDILKSSVEKEVMAILSAQPVIKADIDPVATVHGVLLARCAGYGINRSKLQNYVNDRYRDIDHNELFYSSSEAADQINTLYYALILDQQNNNYKISVSADFVQKRIDGTIRALKFKTEINNDIVAARKAVEIVMDLQIHGIDVKLNLWQVGKIRRGVRKALNIEEISNSVLLTDLYIIDHALGSVIEAEGQLTEELLAGVYAQIGDDQIYNAHRFMVCFDRAGITRYAGEQKEYVRSLQSTTLESMFMGLAFRDGGK